MGDDGRTWRSELISRASPGYRSQSGAGGRRQLIFKDGDSGGLRLVAGGAGIAPSLCKLSLALAGRGAAFPPGRFN